jgi:hypothetical protein
VKTWLKEKIWTQTSEAPVGALERSLCDRAQLQQRSPVLEHLCARAHHKRSSAIHVARFSRVALAAIASCLRRGIPERLRALDRTPHDRAHCDRAHPMRSSAPDLAATLIFSYK